MTDNNPNATPSEPFHEVVVEHVLEVLNIGFKQGWDQGRSVNAQAVGEMTEAEEEAADNEYEMERGLAVGNYMKAIAERALQASDEAFQFADSYGASGSRLSAEGISPTTLARRSKKPVTVTPPRGTFAAEIDKLWDQSLRRRGA